MADIPSLLICAIILSLVDQAYQLNCHSCSPYASGKQYPKCLETIQHCASGQKCTIVYKPGQDLSSSLTMGCTTTCLQFQSSKSNQCAYGGNITSFNTCVKCCQGSLCFNRFKHSLPALPSNNGHTTAAAKQTPRSQQLFCPGGCSASRLDTCWNTRRMCADNEYCNMALNLQTGQLISQCTSKSLITTCHSYTRDHHCPFRMKDAQAYLLSHSRLYGYCYYGCCEDNQCVDDVLNFNAITTARPTAATTHAKTTRTTTKPTTKPTTRPSTTQTTTTQKTTTTPKVVTSQTPTVTFNYSALMTTCVDKLSGSACQTLRDLKDICKAPVGATLCPITCNICQMVKAIKCEDKTQSNDCTKLSASPAFCQDKMAIYICPKSCNLCNELVKSVVDEVLYASPTPDFNQPMTTQQTFHCPELLQSKCEHVKAVCNHSNMRDICPKECNTCA